jgi:thioredoxin-related protein
MRHLVLFSLLACTLAAAVAKTPQSFLTTWEAVQKSAKERHTLIYLHFTTDWCGWCRRIEDDTYTDAKVKAALADFAAASLDCTVPNGKAVPDAVRTNLSLMRKFGGEGYPFLVILSEDGETVYNTISGYLPPEPFLARLQAARQTEKEYKAYLADAAKADAKSYDFSLRTMRMMSRVNRTDDAVAAAKRVLALDPDNAKGDALDAAWIVLESLPSSKWETDGKAYLVLFSRFDKDNAKRFLERVYWTQALDAFQARQFAVCIKTLGNLTAAAKSLANPQDAYGLLGIAYSETGARDQAIANLKKTIAIDPTSARGKWLQGRLDAIAKP